MLELILRRRLAVARIFAGATLAVHYALLLPFAGVTYGRGGVLPSYLDNPVPLGASPLASLDSPALVTGVVAALLGASLAHGAGLFTRSSGVVLWAGAMLLFHRNQLTLNPSLPYLGIWFLAQAFTAPHPAWSLDRWLARRRGAHLDEAPERLPRDILRVLWIVACVGYSFSGLTKLASPSWVRGEAVSLILTSPLGRDGVLGNALLALPPACLALTTWGVVLIELAATPIALFRRARPFLWGALLLVHVGLVLLLDIADISVPMIAFHVLTFDSWAKNRTHPRSSTDLQTRPAVYPSTGDGYDANPAPHLGTAP